MDYAGDLVRLELRLERIDRAELGRCEAHFVERGAGNPHAAFCGSRKRVTAFGDPVTEAIWPPLTRSDNYP